MAIVRHIHAGMLRHKVTIEERSSLQDAMNQPSESWSTHATVWAMIEPVSAREFVEGEMTTGRITHRVIIRALDTVTRDMRVRHGTRTLNIESVRRANNELGEAMELLCIEVT